MTPKDIMVSVIIPMFDEKSVVERTLNEVTTVLQQVTSSYEVIIVDDGSADGTFEEVARAHQSDPRIKGLRFSRNFGKEPAMMAGMVRAAGDVVVTMDGDLQHPPSLIPHMVSKWQEGAQIVHGVKSTRNYGGLFHRTAAKAFNNVFSRTAGINIVDSSDYKLFDADVARLLTREFPEQHRFHRGLSSWVGFRQESVEFEVAARPGGESRWSLYSLVRYGWNTLTSFTSLPLQLVPLMGLVMLIFSVVLGTEALISRINGNAISGFATIEITLLFTGSMLMIGLGVIGQYLARVYEELKKRPVYVVADELGFEQHNPSE